MARSIDITVRPALASVRARMGRIEAAVADRATAYRKISIMLDQWVQQNFRSQGGKVGGWKELAPATLRARRRKNLRGARRRKGERGAGFVARLGRVMILQDTGRLKASLLPFSDARDAGIGSQLPYSRAHEEGLSPIPQRRIQPRSREVIAPARRILDEHVRQALETK